MSDAITNAYYGLDSRMKLIEVITNNLANSETIGFKRDFGRILESEDPELQKLLEVGTSLDMAPGDMSTTRNPLDVAINGPGFFEIQTPNGIRYTRNGSFSLTESGDLVTKDGMKVMSTSGGAINVTGANVAIQDGGLVTVDGNQVSRLKVVSFKNNDQLQKEGMNRLVWNGTADGVQDVAEPSLTGGALEHSNVNSINEMVHLMGAYRDFETVQRTLKTLETDMNGRLIQELGKLT
ncbi:MAG TPA: flagellar hook-basal body protein [Terriglobia bacterium]|nr:flagellar hook-basal body protein [Terriglobia bacterium]